MSIGFEVIKEDIDYYNSSRTLVEVKLWDVSVVTIPAFPTTSATVRSIFEKKKPVPFEKWGEVFLMMQ